MMATKKIEHSELTIARVIHLDDVKMPRVSCPVCEGNGKVITHLPDNQVRKVTCQECMGRGQVAKWRAKTPYMDKVCRDQINVRRAVMRFISEAKTLLMLPHATHDVEWVDAKGVKHEDEFVLKASRYEWVNVPRQILGGSREFSRQGQIVMKALLDLIKETSWMIKHGPNEGKRAWEVIGNEAYMLIKAEVGWAKEREQYRGADAPFSTEDEMIEAAQNDLVQQVKKMGMTTGLRNSLGMELMAANVEERMIRRIVAREEAKYDKMMIDRHNPKLGTTSEMNRRQRAMYARTDAYEDIYQDVLKGKLPRSVVGNMFYKRCLELRSKVFLATQFLMTQSYEMTTRDGTVRTLTRKVIRANMKPTPEQRKVLQGFINKTYVQMHMVAEANALLVYLKSLGSVQTKDWKPLKEYDYHKAGSAHKPSAAKKGMEAKANMTDDEKQTEFEKQTSTESGGAVVYEDRSISEIADPEQQMIMIEEDPDAVDFDDSI